jgi:hypothetical protein
VHFQPAQWLRIRYAPVTSPQVVFGIVLFLPEKEALYYRLRGDMHFVDPDDYEIVTGIGDTIESIAHNRGARFTFEWMESSLSNIIRAEGPFTISTSDPVSTLTELFDEHVQPI